MRNIAQALRLAGSTPIYLRRVLRRLANSFKSARNPAEGAAFRSGHTRWGEPIDWSPIREFYQGARRKHGGARRRARDFGTFRGQPHQPEGCDRIADMSRTGGSST